MLFNMRWLWDKSRKFTCSEEWLDRRFDLFEKYCLPSFIAQTNKDFVWLCLFDKETPARFVSRIEKYKEQCPQFKPCFYDEAEMWDWIGCTRSIIEGYLTDDIEYVITTSLDNDDAIHKDMMDCIQKEFEGNPQDAVYSFKHGYQLYEDFGLAFEAEVVHNHFISLSEKNSGDLKLIIDKWHMDIYKETSPIYLESDKPFWIEYMQSNIAENDIRIISYKENTPLITSLSLRDFGLDITVKKVIISTTS